MVELGSEKKKKIKSQHPELALFVQKFLWVLFKKQKIGELEIRTKEKDISKTNKSIFSTTKESL